MPKSWMSAPMTEVENRWADLTLAQLEDDPYPISFEVRPNSG